ncbi:sulfotransferase domain-containing protein [Coleofasciculus sp. E2-BRE-01]|uniref:sulfotransferase domain-containing protein n=1 Tax=Coleofasciculus sp. E2-BRE-01 TaxID=3069524 RepID=UPI003305343A
MDNYIAISKNKVKRMLINSHLDKLIKLWKRKNADTFIISFPKCGRTWLRLMLSRSIIQHFDFSIYEGDRKVLEPGELSKLNSSVPKIRFIHDDDAFFKSPEELCIFKSDYQYKKVLFLIRDPRDVVVSSFFHKKYRFNFLPKDKSKLAFASYEGELSKFISEPIGSLKTLIAYYNIWANNRHVPIDFMLLRYEDIYYNTISSLRSTLNFMGLKTISDEIVEEAVNYASFENMRKMEENNLFKSSKLKPTNPSDNNTYKTRKGKVGGFRENLNEESILYVNEQVKEYLSSFYSFYYY